MPENLAAAATAAAADEAASAVDPPKVGLLFTDDPLAEIPLFMVMEDGGPPIDGGIDL